MNNNQTNVENKISRKDFLVQTGIAGFALFTGLQVACKKKEEEVKKETETTQMAEGPNCSDVSGLKKEDIEQRKNLKYTDHSPEPNKRCNNCALYIPAEGDSPCGGCNLIKGPISPNGWCTSWVRKG